MMSMKWERREQEHKRRESLSEGTVPSKPRAFFARRPRTCNQQFQSVFFSRLPSEVRKMVYGYVLNDEPFLHVTFDSAYGFCIPNCPGAIRWSLGQEWEVCRSVIEHVECMAVHDRYWNCAAFGVPDPETRIRYTFLLLLRTCRRM